MRHLVFLAALILAVPTAVAENPDWNQWRGPNRDATLTGAEWPAALTDKMELVWEQSHEPSYSGPIVSDGIVFTTETIAKKTEQVTAYDLATGEKRWQVDWEGAMAVPFFAAENGDWIRATPICAEGQLLVLGMRDVLVSLDPTSGKENWRVDFPAAMGTPLPSFGAVCSPLVDQGAVYIQTGGALVKLSLKDGSMIWKALEDSKGMMSSGAFSSPIIAELDGVRQLVVQTRQALCGVDLETGNTLWTEPIEAFRGMNILTPLISGNKVFTSAYQGKAQLFEISQADGKWNIDELWAQKNQAYMSSPVLIGDDIYMHQRNQRVTSLNTNDGTIKWTSSPFGKYWSMVSNGEKILALDSSGELLLINSSDDELDIIDRMKVADDSWAHIAVQGPYVIVRDLRALKVYRWQ
ncbi:MAG: PQQ-binding-like beta-propeller repeat protein [Planctomycetota bacterium]